MNLAICPVCHQVENTHTPHQHHGKCRLCDQMVHCDERGTALHHMKRGCFGSSSCHGSGYGIRGDVKPRA